jgi:hypothetical protein
MGGRLKGSILQEVWVLNDDRAPTPRSRNRVVQQTALVLGVTTDLVWPQNDHALELPVLCLLYRHGSEGAVVCAVTLALHRQLAGDNCFDLGASARFRITALQYVIVDEPKAACQESSFACGQAVASVLAFVAQNEFTVDQEPFLDRPKRSADPRVIGRKKASIAYCLSLLKTSPTAGTVVVAAQ